MKAVVAIQVLWSVVAACGAIVYTPPQHCDWTERDGALGEVSLSCHLGALLSDLDSGNFSSSQADPVTELRVVCSDPLLTQPSLPSQAFRRLHNLDTLTIEYCNLKELQPGTFQGLEGMRRMTVRSYISEGPFMTLKPNSLEGMPRLQRLDLGHSYIKSLPGQVLCPVPALRHLNLTGNLLQDASEVDVSGNCGTNLVTLDMSRNDLVVIPRAGLAGLESLEALYLQHNKLSRWLTQGALLGLSSLNLLNLSSNGLDRLSPDLFRETLNLTELYIQNNSLSRLWPHDLLSRLSHLTTLDLSNNLLTSEGVTSGIFHGLLQLTMLNLSHNRLTQVSVDMFRDLAALQVLNLSHNNLTVVTDKTLSLLTNLHRLDLSHNALHVVSCRSFAGLHALSSLALAYNNIYWVASDAFENCTGLRDLSLEHNLLQDVPKAVHEATALRTLRLNHNKLTNISQDDLSPLDALRHLDLSGNLLTSVCKACLTALPALEVLDLSRNELESISQGTFDRNKKLQKLRIDGNKIREITGLFTLLPNLLHLNMSNNNITWFDYALVPSQLQGLDLHNNQMTELANYYSVEDQIQLKTLDASHNNLQELSRSSVPHTLHTLLVNDNRITKIGVGTFANVNNLFIVNLSNNLLTEINLAAILLLRWPEQRAMPKFYIGGNPVFCDCNMEWLHRMRQDSASPHRPRFMDLDQVTCSLPYSRTQDNHIPFLETQPSHFLCSYTSHCWALCQCCDFENCDCRMECPETCVCYHDTTWRTKITVCEDQRHPFNTTRSNISKD